MPERTRFQRDLDRIRWAKQIHIGLGLIGRGTNDNVMRTLIEMYRGDQWRDEGLFAGLGPGILRTANKIFPIANRQQAGIAARNPRVQYFPRNEDQAARARRAEALHNYDIVEDSHILAFNAALRDHQFARFPGIVRHGYTPPEELFDDQGRRMANFRAHPNRPWMKRWATWDTLIDPRAESFEAGGGAMWCAFRSVMTLDAIKRNPNMIARENLKNFKGNINPRHQEMKPTHLKSEEDPDQDSYVEVWTVYDLEDKTWNQLTLNGVDRYLREPAEWPIAWEDLPYDAFIVHPQMDTPFPRAMLEDLLPYQNELNQVRTMLSILARSIRRPPIYDKNKFESEEIDKLVTGALAEAIACQGEPGSAIESQTLSGFPQELLQYAGVIVDDMRESVGLSLFARARRENVESATEAANIAQGQDVIEARTQDAFDRFLRNAERKYMQGRRAVLAETGEQEVVRVLGAQGAQELESYFTVDAEDLAGEYDFHVEAGSTRPRDLDAEAQKAAVDLQVLGALPFTMTEFLAQRYAEMRRIDPARVIRPQAAQATNVQDASEIMRGAGLEGTNGQGIDANLAALLAAQGEQA